ncbi:MAG: hypothetical protein ACXWQO_02420 [Bdellovibrionota bacterium]
MKIAFFLVSFLIVSSPAFAANIQKFTSTSLIPILNGPGNFGDPFMHDRCDQAEQAQAMRSAEEAAKADCEKAPGVGECLVKSSRITFNSADGSRVPDDILAKYGIQPNGNGYGYWGCEAEALVYGLE